MIITFDRTDFKGGFIAEQFQIAVNLTNHDSVAHDVTVQANFYDVEAAALGDDPADHLVTAGSAKVTIQAGRQTAVLIGAKNVAHARILSVGFTAICAGKPVSLRCGDRDPYQ